MAVFGGVGCDTVDTNSSLDGGPPGLTPTEHVLRVTRVGPGSGFVRSAPEGILCAPDCEARFAAGVTVELTAEPSPGSMFIGWGGECDGTAPVCEVQMGNTRVVSAQFYAPGSGDAGVVSDAGLPPLPDASLSDAGLSDGGAVDAAEDGGDLDAGDLDAAEDGGALDAAALDV